MSEDDMVSKDLSKDLDLLIFIKNLSEVERVFIQKSLKCVGCKHLTIFHMVQTTIFCIIPGCTCNEWTIGAEQE